MHLCEMCSEEMRKVINIFNSRSFHLYTKRENLLKNMPEKSYPSKCFYSSFELENFVQPIGMKARCKLLHWYVCESNEISSVQTLICILKD